MRIIVDFHSWFIRKRFQLRQAIMKWLHTAMKRPIANSLVYFGILLRRIGLRKAGLKFILKGRRVDDVHKANTILQTILDQKGGTNTEFSDLLGKVTDHPINKNFASRLLIMKLPVQKETKVIEKGAIIIKFTETFGPIYLSLDINLLSKYFQIILEPSWAGYSVEDILAWRTLSPESVIVFSPYHGDFNFLQNLKSNIVPVNIGAADWVNPKIFHKVNYTEKIYDAIYVANFNPAKRVDRYIQAIKQITRFQPKYHAALVCAGHGDAKSEILAMLDWVKDKANISFFHGMDQSKLNLLFNQSKVNVLLSLREGANKVLAEGMFSGTPALLLSENIGVKHENINTFTGKIVPDSELENTLLWFSKNYINFSPHQWAETHISPTVSTQNLSLILRRIEESEGREWTSDLFPKVNQPELAYLQNEHAWLLDKRAEFLHTFSKGTTEEKILNYLKTLTNAKKSQHAIN